MGFYGGFMGFYGGFILWSTLCELEKLPYRVRLLCLLNHGLRHVMSTFTRRVTEPSLLGPIHRLVSGHLGLSSFWDHGGIGASGVPPQSSMSFFLG